MKTNNAILTASNTTDEVRIDNTIFRVKRTFSGEESIAEILSGWAVNKTLQLENSMTMTDKTASLPDENKNFM